MDASRHPNCSSPCAPTERQQYARPGRVRARSRGDAAACAPLRSGKPGTTRPTLTPRPAHTTRGTASREVPRIKARNPAPRPCEMHRPTEGSEHRTDKALRAASPNPRPLNSHPRGVTERQSWTATAQQPPSCCKSAAPELQETGSPRAVLSAANEQNEQGLTPPEALRPGLDRPPHREALEP